MKSAAEVAKKWAQRASAAQPDYVAGIEAVTEAPGAKAAAKADKYIAKVTENVEKWADNVGATTLNDWKNATKGKAGRYAQGVQQGTSNMGAFLNEYLPYVEQGRQQVANMPDMTVEDGVARAAAMIRHNANFKRR